MTMPTIFDVNAQPEEIEPFVPTADDYYVEDEDTCAECGGDLSESGRCYYCEDGERDFPLYLEYEGAYGLSGYDSYYDNDSDLMNEW